MSDIVRPEPEPDSAPFWEALREHRLTVQCCRGCEAYRFPARPICPRCGRASATWAEVSGWGRLLSWTVTHHVTHPAFARQLPYTVVYVELAEQPGLMMYGNLRPAGAELRMAMTMQAVFEDVADDLTLVQWMPASTEAGP